MKKASKFLIMMSSVLFLSLPLTPCYSTLASEDNIDYTTRHSAPFQQAIGIEKLGAFQGLDLSELYQQVVASVVSVLNYNRSDSLQSIGSGVLYYANQVAGRKVYYVITNHHVVKGNTKLRILTHDSLMKDALLIGTDSVQDLAVLMVTSYGLQDSQIASLPSNQLSLIPTPQTFDPVFAIGNPSSPFLKGTLTAGIVSNGSRNTSSETTKLYEQSHAIQVDLALNPGNSGGPLFNKQGQLIGINTYKVNKVGDLTFEGLNFSLPIHDMYLGAERIRTSALISFSNNEYVVTQAGTFFKPAYGAFELASLLQISLSDRNYLKIPPTLFQGVLLKGVGVSSSFGQAGLPRYAIIHTIDGIVVKDIVDARKILMRAQANQQLVITYYAPTATGYASTLTSATIMARAS